MKKLAAYLLLSLPLYLSAEGFENWYFNFLKSRISVSSEHYSPDGTSLGSYTGTSKSKYSPRDGEYVVKSHYKYKSKKIKWSSIIRWTATTPANFNGIYSNSLGSKASCEIFILEDDLFEMNSMSADGTTVISSGQLKKDGKIYIEETMRSPAGNIVFVGRSVISRLQPIYVRPVVKEKFSKPRPVEDKIAESPPVEVKVAESPPIEEKVAESPPIEEKVAESPPVEEKAAESPPIEDKIAESPPVEEKATESPPVEEKVAESPPIEEKATESPPVEDKAAESPPDEEKATESPPIEDKVAESPPVEEKEMEPPASRPHRKMHKKR